MKPVGFIATGVLLLLFGAVAPTYAQQDQHEQDAKPAKQEQKAKPEKKQEAKPAKQEQQAKPEKQQEAKAPKQEHQAKPEKQQEAKAPKQEQQAKPEKQQEAKAPKQEHQAKPAKEQEAKAPKQEQQHQAKGQQEQRPNTQKHEQPQGNWAHSGQRDNRGHEYNESRFGREHHARFEENGGRFYNGRREYSYGGYWFYAGAYPPWFYGQEVYFIMGADGLWYAVAYDDPSLMFQVDID